MTARRRIALAVMAAVFATAAAALPAAVPAGDGSPPPAAHKYLSGMDSETEVIEWAR